MSPWVLQAMPADEKSNPVEVGLFGPKAVMQVANPLTQLAQQADQLQRWIAGFHRKIYTCIKIQYFANKARLQMALRGGVVAKLGRKQQF